VRAGSGKVAMVDPSIDNKGGVIDIDRPSPPPHFRKFDKREG
jgi:hypothetical protein